MSNVSHTHCYCCDKILYQDDYDNPDYPSGTYTTLANTWESGKILVDGTTEIYNYRIMCFVCNHYRIQLPLETAQSFDMSHLNSLAMKEHIDDDERAKSLYYSNYSLTSAPTPIIEVEIPSSKSKCCILL